MKKYISCLLLAVMLFTLFGCGQKPENTTPAAPAEQPAVQAADSVPVTQPAGTGNLEEARSAYAALSEADKQSFYEELTAEQAAREAAWLEERKADLASHWVFELDFYEGHAPFSDYYNYEMTLREDMTYDYGKFSGTWQFSENGRQIELVNAEDGVIYFIIDIVEEDGFTKLMVEDYLYVRSEDHKEAFNKKYVTFRGSQLAPYIGEMQYMGTIPEGVWDGPTGNCYIFDSLAYDQGLIYAGVSDLFEMEYLMDDGYGNSYQGRRHNPFETLFLDRPYTVSDLYITKGKIFFIRSEYVESVSIMDDGNSVYREIRTTLGNTLYDYSLLGWEFLPKENYNNFLY